MTGPMTANVQLHLHGEMDHLRIVWQTGETLLESIPFGEDPDGTRYNLLLAIQEMLTNVLRHAYAGHENEPVVVEFFASDTGMAVEIRDRGPEFNPVVVEMEPDEENPPPEGGGYGIMIAKIVMDDLDYQREAGWNVLRMSKAAEPPRTADASEASGTSVAETRH